MIAFSHFAWKHGIIGDLDRQFPSYLSAWDTQGIIMPPFDTHYIYVHEGTAHLEYNNNEFPLYQGMFAVVPGLSRLSGGKGIIVSRENYDGLFQIGGPVEHSGRLKYIDGCTDTLLASPVRMGDPCLNLLFFPADIDQTAHTHPSDRIGMIMSGKGRCHAWNNGKEEIIDLIPGMIFCIHTDGFHKFSTPYGEHMRVLAYHPDSDFGPTDQNHPMINRTMVHGQSASNIESIRTK